MKNMIKILSVIGAVLMAGHVAAAGTDQTILTFSTSGADRYCDGSVVADGECYALVFTKSGSVFAGFKADGSLVNPADDLLVAVAPLAVDGHCKRTAFIIDSNYYKKHSDDKKAVYLLDTRCAGGRPAGLVNGRLVRVRNYSAVPDMSLNVRQVQKTAATSASGYRPSPLVANKHSDMTGVPRPQITKVWIDGENMYVNVAKTVSNVTYGLKGGQVVNALNAGVESEEVDGAATATETITMSVPLKDASFVRAICK